MKFVEYFSSSLPKRAAFYLFSITFLFAFTFVIVHFKAAATEASVYISPAPYFTPSQLVDDINARLAHLQHRVTGAAFYVHKVRMKENLWKISYKKRFSVHSIIGCNPQLKTYDVSINQKILIPSRGGVLHQIQKGDTWQSIAKRYRVEDPLLEKTNAGVLKLVPGELVFIPGGKPDMELMNEDMRKKYELRALFVLPLGGRLSSTFGMRRHPITGQRSLHGGIDIAVREGSWVGAAADGIVILASDNVGHYGKAVFIDHQNGYITHYGHLSKILVHEGQHVREHQLIAKSGSTGRSTGPHLHFTIKKNGQAIDPLKFLW
jgi:LysM repeat protein